MKKEYVVRVATGQYEFVEVKAESPEQARKEYIAIINAWKEPLVEPENTPKSNLNLQPVPFLRLLYKVLCNGGLIQEEIDSLGTEKIYSQKDILKIQQSLVNKAKRESQEPTINQD